MFKIGQKIKHTKGGVYRIVRLPDWRKLECCGESFYEYECTENRQIWIRKRSEMEDGRFVLVEE